MNRLIAGQDVRLELGVDLDGPALGGLLLVGDKLSSSLSSGSHLRERRSLMRSPKKIPHPIRRLSAYFSSR